MILTEVVMNVVTAGHLLTKISNKSMSETRNCEVGLTIAPRTFTSCEILGGCRALKVVL